MLNIISNEIFKPSWHTTGQTKVFRNLIKGLDLIGYPYVLNKKHGYCNRLWIYNDQKAVDFLGNVDTKKIKVIIGPIFSLNSGDNAAKNLKECVMLQPSEWSKKLLLESGFNACAVDYWPVGIDTDEFYVSDEKKEFILIYYKQRFRFELALVIKALQQKGLIYKIIEYGSYDQAEYKNLMDGAKYIIWLGRQESQGIAMGEALAKNIPLLVWEVSCLGHWQPSTEKEKTMFKDSELAFTEAKSATYFDNTCGYVFKHAEELTEGIEYMEKNINSFTPRKFIMNNLSIKGQAQVLLDLYEKHWPESIINNDIKKEIGNWKSEKTTKVLAEVYYKIKK